TWGPTAQALSGLTMMSGLPGKPPAGWGYSFMDHTAGYYAAIAIMMALHERNRSGAGQHIDMSQVEVGIALAGPAILDYTVNGRSWRRDGMPPGNHAWGLKAAPHNVYRCTGDDRWIAIAVLSDAEWEALVRAMGSPAWASRPSLSSVAGRIAAQDLIDREIEEWTSQREDYALAYTLQAAGVRAAMVQKASDRFERDPQLRARGWWHRLVHDRMGPSDYDGIVPALSDTPGELRRPGPLLGVDTHQVMRDVLGMSEGEFAAHEDSGVFM
ncbi:MAG: CoA transferase, partial [Dehalococcoidia bacterium]